MKMKPCRLALALAACLCASAQTLAQSTREAPAGSGQRFQGILLIDPSTGQPYAATGGGGGGGGATGSVTAAGTNGTAAQAVQGINGGVPLAVTWSGQTVGVTGTVTANQGAPASTANAWPTTDTNVAQTVAAPGTSAGKAQGVQGVSGGVPLASRIDHTTPGTTDRVVADQGAAGTAPWPVLPVGITPTRTMVSVAAASIQLVAANSSRRAVQVTCDGTSQVGLSQIGGTLTANTLTGGADTIIPASAANAYIPPMATKSAITAYGTSTAQNCVVTEWSQ